MCRYFICYISSPHTLVLNARKRWWLSKYCSYCTKQTLSTTHNKKQPHKCLDIIFSFIITRIMNTLHTAITLSSNARVQRAKNVHTEVKMLLSFLECISSTLIQHKERRRWGWRWGEGGRRIGNRGKEEEELGNKRQTQRLRNKMVNITIFYRHNKQQ